MPATDTPPAEPQTLQQQLITHLSIPVALTARPRHVELPVAYAKYLGVLSAQSNMNCMIADGIWPFDLLNTDTLVELFVSKSVWYTHYVKIFPWAQKFPDLVKWLECADDAPEGASIFGVEKHSYNFKELKNVLEMLEISAYKKGKKRLRDESEDVDQGTKKKHKKHSSKGRHISKDRYSSRHSSKDRYSSPMM
jgi:hypothetical protein